MDAIRILIADDHPLMRAALKEAIAAQFDDARIVEASSVDDVVALLASGPAIDTLLLDLMMPGVHGFSALVRLRAQFPAVPVIVVSATEDASVVDHALMLGASGYVFKSSPVEAVGETIRIVFDGGVVRPFAGRAANGVDAHDAAQFRKLRTLTPQQLNVLEMIAEGVSNKTIARRLDIAESTVKAHTTGILLKLGLQRRTQAAVLAQRALQYSAFSSKPEWSGTSLDDDAYPRTQ